MIGQLRNKLTAKKLSTDLSLRWDLEGYLGLQQSPPVLLLILSHHGSPVNLAIRVCEDNDYSKTDITKSKKCNIDIYDAVT